MSPESSLPSLHRIRLLGAALAVVLLAGKTALAGDKTAVKTLSEIPLFAFGGIGAAGITSNGEYAFHSVFTSDTAAADFLQILKNGTPQAQCYALVGLRLKDRAAFEEQVKQFASSKKQVDTCAGCAPERLPMDSVVANIRRGDFDSQAKSKPR